jgi:hypothetical protein
MQNEGKTWTKEAVISLIQTNNEACGRALWGLYQRQTADEQSSEQTRHHNGVGFNGRDAEFLTSVAKKLPHYHYKMTPKQHTAVARAIKKYVGQLMDIIEEKGGKVDRKSLKSDAAQSLNREAANSPELPMEPPAQPQPAMAAQHGAW